MKNHGGNLKDSLSIVPSLAPDLANVKSGLTTNCKPSYHYPYTTLTLIHNKLIDQRTHNTVATFSSNPSQIFDQGQSAIIFLLLQGNGSHRMFNAHARKFKINPILGVSKLPNTNQ